MLLRLGAKKEQEPSYRDVEKEEMFRQQQELLEARRSGRTMQDANARRQKVAVSGCAAAWQERGRGAGVSRCMLRPPGAASVQFF